jgi:hypothetical protein
VGQSTQPSHAAVEVRPLPGSAPNRWRCRLPGREAYDGAADQRTTPDNPTTELLDSTLYLGSPDPTDAVYTALRIERISHSGFWGRFDGSDGLAVSIDSTIRSLGHARGVFCAIRLADTESP